MQKGQILYSGCKDKAAEYHLKNKDVIKEKANSNLKNLSEENKEAKIGIKIWKKKSEF